jgi:TonB family protein
LLSAGGREPAAARGDAQTSGAQLSGAGEAAGKAEPVREASARALQTQQPSGEAKVVPERFSAATIAVDSPRSVCELPLMFAGFDRKPIPRGLDTINATELLRGETPPRHHPGNQAPRYPLQALPLRAEGRTLVRAEVRADGSVGQLLIKQTSGFQALDAAALETVRSWRFQPAQRNGAPVVMWMDVPIEYKLPQAQGVYR